MDAARRIAARLYARSLGIEMQRLPKPVDLAALRIPLVNFGKTAAWPAGDFMLGAASQPRVLPRSIGPEKRGVGPKPRPRAAAFRPVESQ